MNILIKRFGLYVCIAFLFTACEEDNIVGFELNPNQDNIETTELILELPSRMSRYDSVVTNEVGYLLAGRLQDPVFGSVIANAFTEVRPIDISPDIGDTATYGSLRMQLSIDNFYGGPLQVGNTQTLNIHQAAQVFEFTKVRPIGSLLNFFQFDNVEFEQEPIGTLQLPLTASEEDGGTFFVDLDDQFGNQLFEDLRDGVIGNFDSTSVQRSFNEYFKGLAIVGDPNNNLVLRINDNAKLILEYNLDADSTTQIELFIDRSSSTSSSPVYGFSELLIDRSGTETSFLNTTDRIINTPFNKSYIQAGGAAFPLIDLGPLKTLSDTAENFLINKVVLELEIEEFDEGFAPPATLFFDVIDEDGITETISGVNVGLLQSGTTGIPSSTNQRIFAIYDDETGTYSVDFTGYTRILPLVEEPVTEFQLIPISLNSTLNRAVFKEDGLRVRVIYTTFTR